MTKKDYAEIAGAIKEACELVHANEATQAGYHMRILTQNLANVFKENDPRFNPYKFLEATGIEGYHWVTNLMSRKLVLEEDGTPLCCSVGSETYWSM